MKHDVFLYLKISGLAHDSGGNLSYAGLKMTIGSTDKDIPYSEIMKRTTSEVKEAILKLIPFQNIQPKDMIIITPEEYERDYG